jgi:hypothetical protein
MEQTLLRYQMVLLALQTQEEAVAVVALVAILAHTATVVQVVQVTH